MCCNCEDGRWGNISFFLISLAVSVFIAFGTSGFVILNQDSKFITPEQEHYSRVMGFLSLVALVTSLLATAGTFVACLCPFFTLCYDSIVKDIAKKQLDLQGVSTKGDEEDVSSTSSE